MQPCHQAVWSLTEQNGQLDVDFFAFNLPVCDEIVDVLRRFVGNTVGLANSTHRRFKRRENYNAMYLSYSPIIISTVRVNGLKNRICHALCHEGFIAVVSAEEVEHLIRGLNKAVPVERFISALQAAGVEYIRLQQFGMKQEINGFPVISDEILE